MEIIIGFVALLVIAIYIGIKNERKFEQHQVNQINSIGEFLFEHLNIYADDFEFKYNPDEYVQILFKDKIGRWCAASETSRSSVGDCFSLVIFKKFVSRENLEWDRRLIKHQYDVIIDDVDYNYPSNYYEEQCNLLRAFISFSKKLYDKEFQLERGVIIEEVDEADITKEKVINTTLIQLSNNTQDYINQ